MTEKRFNIVQSEIVEDGKFIQDNNKKYSFPTTKDSSSLIMYEKALNELSDENEQLKKELKVYRKIATCGNCNYHNYDWFDDGDEFEVCDKGNDTSNMICEDWEEL